jgi:hypothetical protein
LVEKMDSKTESKTVEVKETEKVEMMERNSDSLSVEMLEFGEVDR